jgi:DamX protein
MSALVSPNEINAKITNQNSSVAAISTNARIDYILRFSKQAVLVVDELTSNYSHIGSLFLGDLPDEHNAAYLAVSAKFTEIQIRCRLIEQLFPAVLFDPEQPLAISILRLAKENSQPISIVIDHAHLLPLKILHELCYLAEVAKKAKKVINVVMLATFEAGKKINIEKSLFKGRIAIVSAENGQLLQFDNKLFKEKRSINVSKYIKFLILFIIILALSVAAFLGLKNRELFSFSALPQTKMNQIKPIEKQLNKVKNTSTIATKAKVKILAPAVIKATAADIFKVLTESPPVVLPAAKPSDILTALDFTNTNTVISKAPKVKANLLKNKETMSSLVVDKAQHSNHKIFNSDYYLQASQGYVIQLTGFVDDSVFQQEKANYQNIDYGIYTRELNGQKFMVVTSKVYSSKSQALAAIKLLPAEIRKQRPWIKAIAAIHNEIKTYRKSLIN